MKFGFFNDSDREYVITSPATPQPWINYLGNEEFFSLISNTCGGYSFYKDAKLLRLTRYRYNNVPADTNGRYYFIKHNDTVWTPAWQPVKTELDSYECRHGLGYSRFTSSKNKIEAKLTAFVPLHETCEVNQLILTNNNETCEQLDLTSYVEFCFWNAVDDATNFQRNLSLGEVEVCGSEIYHKTEYRERRNHFAYYTVNAEIDGFDTSRDAFLGVYGSIERPQTVLTRASSDSIASGGAVIGSHHLKVILKPGESKSFVFVLGYSENPYEDKWEAPNIIKKDAARAAMKRFSTDEQVEKALNDLKEYWNTLLATFSVDSADEKLNRMVNIWNQYQCMVTFNMSRSASYFESGTGRGMGFRDSCQDLLGFVHLIPDRARQRILDIAATQFEDGSAYHQYQPLTKKGNSDIGSGFNDDPLWLIAGTAAYIKETGDLSILDEMVDFNNDPALAKPLSEHLKRSFDYTLTHLGPNGLPLIGRADWNDCLRLGKRGESTFVAMQLYYAMTVIKYFAEMKNDAEYIDYVNSIQYKMGETIQKKCWEDDRFIRGYKEGGQVIGSKNDPEASMWLNPQSWAVISGLATREQSELALESVHRELNTEYGVRLMFPPYREHAFDGALMLLFNAGTKENAGIFSQPQGWIILAEALMGHGNRAFEYFNESSPASMNDKAEIRKLEPYCHGQFTESVGSPFEGRAHVHWLTGTASTCMVGCVEGIMGMRPDFGGIKIAPSVPSDWKEFEIEKVFRGKKLSIKVQNPDGHESGFQSMTVNGETFKSNYIPASALKDENDIVLVM